MAGAAGPPLRGGDALVEWENVGLFAGEFDITDGGEELDISCFEDGRSGNFETADECIVRITQKTYWKNNSWFELPYSLRKNQEYSVDVFPDATDITKFWNFATLKVMSIHHVGTAGRNTLQPIDVTGRARASYHYPSGVGPFVS